MRHDLTQSPRLTSSRPIPQGRDQAERVKPHSSAHGAPKVSSTAVAPGLAEAVARCFLAQFTDTPCRFRADGQPDRAHLIPAQRLRQAGRPDQDERLVVPSCRRHHGDFDVTKTIRLAQADYPPSLYEYASEHGFYWAGERDGWRAEHREAA